MPASIPIATRRSCSIGSKPQADDAGKAFRAWAQAHGLLLVPPENGTAS